MTAAVDAAVAVAASTAAAVADDGRAPAGAVRQVAWAGAAPLCASCSSTWEGS